MRQGGGGPSRGPDLRNPRTSPGATVLEQKHMVSILLFLMGNGASRKTEIYGAVSGNPRMPEKLDILESCGLVVQEHAGGSRAVVVGLTDLGREVGSRLSEIDAMISRDASGKD